MRNDRNSLRNTLEVLAGYGLSQADTVEAFDVGTDKYLTYFEQELLENLVFNGGATCRFYEGAYGAGKTHLLQMLNRLALKKGMVVAHTDLTQATSLEDWRVITRYILENMEVNIAGVPYKSLPEILAAIGRYKEVDLNSIKKAALPHAGFFNAMVYATGKVSEINEEAWSKLRDFLLGNKVGVSELKKCGLAGVKNPLSNRNAELVLKTVLRGLYYLGLPGTMLLFDENEKTLVSNRSVPPKKIKMGANLIRRLIDGCTNGILTGTVVVFAVLPGFLENCAMVYPALGQRLQMDRELNKPAWRWPAMPVDLVNTTKDPDEFLVQAINRIEGIVKDCGGNTKTFRSRAFDLGQEILNRNAGSGYKRELLKALASQALRAM
jgi:hypothetical protein